MTYLRIPRKQIPFLLAWLLCTYSELCAQHTEPRILYYFDSTLARAEWEIPFGNGEYEVIGIGERFDFDAAKATLDSFRLHLGASAADSLTIVISRDTLLGGTNGFRTINLDPGSEYLRMKIAIPESAVDDWITIRLEGLQVENNCIIYVLPNMDQTAGKTTTCTLLSDLKPERILTPADARAVFVARFKSGEMMSDVLDGYFNFPDEPSSRYGDFHIQLHATVQQYASARSIARQDEPSRLIIRQQDLNSLALKLPESECLLYDGLGRTVQHTRTKEHLMSTLQLLPAGLYHFGFSTGLRSILLIDH